MKKLFTLLLSSTAFFAYAQKQNFLLVGTYTGGKSKGIYVYQFNEKTGEATLVDSIVSANPSYLAVSPDQNFVYAVNELGTADGGGKVTAYKFDKKGGQLIQLNQQSSMGEHPCYITVDNSGKWVITGNYSSGNVAVLPVQKDGSLGTAVTVVQHSGSSVQQRQKSPHVHATVLSGNNLFLYVPDLGIDKLMIYSFNEGNGSLVPKDTTLKMKAGSGPRHFTFHPNERWAYLIEELTGTVTVFQNTNGNLKPLQTISVLPPGFSKPFTSADIHVSPDGRFLYTSTRDESNTLAIFSINGRSGKLASKGHHSTLGKTPRNFNFDPSGNFLLVANQNSDEIVVLNRAKKTGALKDTGKRIIVGNPVCIKWITE